MVGKKKEKPQQIHAVCFFCKKTDFRANMVGVGWAFDLWAHKECDRKAREVVVCPHCKGTGEVPIEKEGECVQGIK